MNMCTKYQVDILKMAEIWHKTCQKQALFTSFRDFTVIFRILFLTDFDASKSVLGNFSCSLRKSDLKICIAALNHDFFCLAFFTWWPEMTLTSIMVTKHSKWYLKNVFTLTWPVTSLVTPRSIQFVFLRQFFQGFQMPLEFLESVH